MAAAISTAMIWQSTVVEAHVSGGGDVFVTVNKTLDATVHGGGDIRYKGNGSVQESHTAGGGNISKG